MSEQAARAFIERMKADGAFREKVLAVDDPDERLALIRAEGYPVTQMEVDAGAGALEDSDIEDVTAAGESCFFAYCACNAQLCSDCPKLGCSYGLY